MVPMMPLAPGRLSITTDCLVFSSIRLPIRRAVMSPEPPGPNGTMILIGRDGYDADRAGNGVIMLPISARTERRLIPILCMTRASIRQVARLRDDEHSVCRHAA